MIQGSLSKAFVPDIRRRLGLLVLEEEPLELGIARITTDQEWRTTQRLLGQIKTAEERKPKVPKVPKPKKPKVPKVTKPPKIPRIKVPRKRKVKHESEPGPNADTTALP